MHYCHCDTLSFFAGAILPTNRFRWWWSVFETIVFVEDAPTQCSRLPVSLAELTPISFSAATSTVAATTSKSSSHVTRCSDSQRNYCVNGGKCFTLEIMPGSTKFLCRYDVTSWGYVADVGGSPVKGIWVLTWRKLQIWSRVAERL